jgi:hypothetical protein
MGHGYLPEWLNLDGRLPGLQQLPISLQFSAVDFRPRLDEALLRLWQAAAETFNGVDSEHSRMLLVERVKVRAVVLSAGFYEHPNDDSEEPGEFGHLSALGLTRIRWSG